MPNLLAGLLGTVDSYVTPAKRRLADLLQNPLASGQQALGLLADNAATFGNNALMAQEGQDLKRMGSVMGDAPMYRNALSNVTQGLMGMAPVGMMKQPDGAMRMEIARLNAAKPISEGGLGLPLNNTAADRAKAMGFTSEAYHATGADIPAFDISKSSPAAAMGPGTYVSSQKADGVRWATGKENANVMPLLARDADVLKMQELNAEDAAKLSKYLGREIKPGSVVPYFSLERRGGSVSQGAANAGFSGVEHAGPGAGIPNTVYMDPTALRSRFAAFDPARRNSADLLAGGLPFMYLMPQDEKK